MRQLTTRRSLTADRTRLWKEQGGLCFWCFRPIEESRMVVDHVVPRAYCGHDRKSNLVGSCIRCNATKSDKVFNNEQEVREYVEKERARKEKVFRVQREFHPDEVLAEVLQDKVSNHTLGKGPSESSVGRCQEGLARRCLSGMCCMECFAQEELVRIYEFAVASSREETEKERYYREVVLPRLQKKWMRV